MVFSYKENFLVYFKNPSCVKGFFVEIDLGFSGKINPVNGMIMNLKDIQVLHLKLAELFKDEIYLDEKELIDRVEWVTHSQVRLKIFKSDFDYKLEKIKQKLNFSFEFKNNLVSNSLDLPIKINLTTLSPNYEGILRIKTDILQILSKNLNQISAPINTQILMQEILQTLNGLSQQKFNKDLVKIEIISEFLKFQFEVNFKN